MTVRLISSLILLVFWLTVGMADDKQPKKNAAAAEDKPEQIAKAKAEEIAQATLKGEFGKILDLTYPEIVKLGGGREKLIASMTKEFKDWESKGIKIQSTKIGNTSQVLAGGDKLFAVVPLSLEIKVPGGTLAVSSFLLGISPDNGKTWTFINGDKAHDDTVRKMLPNLPAELKLPNKEKPVLHKDE